MADRRPAKDQPAHFAWNDESKAIVETWIAKYPQGRQASASIPLLWQAQKQEGWVSIPAIEAVARQLGMPYIRVYEVATFYTMFNLKPEGKYFVQLCGTTPCMLRGAEDLAAVCARVIGPQGTITQSGNLSWLEVECLGACCNAPMVQINDYYYEDLTPENFENILRKLDKGEHVAPGVFNEGRHTSDPEGDNTSLTDPSLYDGSAAAKIDKLPNSEPAA